MDDARVQRLGRAFGQLVAPIVSDEPPHERQATSMMLVGQLSFEYQAAEEQAREEARQAGHAAGYQAGYDEGRTAGCRVTWELGVAYGRDEAQQQAESSWDPQEQGQEESSAADGGDGATPSVTKASVH